jgi:hypothetical protein
VQFNGCVLRANNAATDFALVEMNNRPVANSGIHYAGWSRQTTGITSTTVLHHPQGDLMKISGDNAAPAVVTSFGVDCWQLDLDWGRLEGGSSGAPYFNQNHQVIGQHWRRPDADIVPVCNITVALGGRFDQSWTGGGTNATRLSNWLDPSNSNVMTTNTSNVSNLFPNFTISGSDLICTNATYQINNLPAGATVTWSASPAGVVSFSSGIGNTTIVTKVADRRNVVLTASISNTCASSGIQIQKTISVGTPRVMGPSVVYPPDGCLPPGSNVVYNAVVDPTSPVGSLIWGYYEGFNYIGSLILVQPNQSGDNYGVAIPNKLGSLLNSGDYAYFC